MYYLGNVKLNSGALHAFAKVVKVMIHTGPWDVKLSWYSLSVLLSGFVFMAWSMAMESIVLGLPNFALMSRFLQLEQNSLNYLVSVTVIIWIFTFCTMNVFGCFHSIMA